MPGKGKDSSSSSSNKNSLDEIKVLLNEKFDDFSKKLISIEEKFDTTAREIYIKMEQIEKKAEDPKANASNHCYIINFIVHVSSQFCQSTLH